MKSMQIVGASLLASLLHASPIEHRDGQLVEKRQGPGSYYTITGAMGGVHPRLEIRDLEKRGDMWNLFLLTIANFQAMDQSVIDSWYQIAGIHGMPWIPWDGVEGSAEGRTPGQLGYCPHSQILFGTWHRPYLALFEQKLQSVATSVASEFPTSTRASYQDAATKLRIPFWDWAKALPAEQPVVPTSMSNEKVQVTFPNGTVALIDNPLYEYKFHPLNNNQINGTGCPNFAGSGGVPQVCQESQQTVRAGFPTSDHDNLNRKLRAVLPSQRSSLYITLSQWQTFNMMTTTANCNASKRAGSIEAVHNPIHNLNYPGHMSPSGVTAFDPMFWFHHANVDRQLALWQAVYPETYIEPCNADTPTYTIDMDEVLNADSPLTPFHRNAAGDFWTSALARDISKMGYTYPELVNNPSNESLVASIKTQYSGPVDVPVTRTKDKTKRQDAAPEKKELYFAQVDLPVYGLDNGEGGANPYNVLLFMGHVDSDVKNWLSSDSFVGLASTLGGLGIQIDQKTLFKIDLSIALEKAISNRKTTEDNVIDYMKENLHWRLELGEVEIPKEKVQDLEVKLVSIEVEVAQSEGEFEKWVGGFKEHALIEN